jgi:phosphoglycolate phosphatase
MINGDAMLVLWDIDGTLLRTNGAIRQIYVDALRQVFGVEAMALPDMAGRTEMAITRDMLAMHGIADGMSRFAEFSAALVTSTETARDLLRDNGTALPGAAAAIGELSAIGATQTLVTGNLPAIAEIKLATFDLTHHLDLSVGGYGDDSYDRPDLVRQAMRRAAATYGRDFDPRRTIVIGDTPHDITAARETGVLSLGVATGRFQSAELTASGADAVLPDLTDTGIFVAAVAGLLGISPWNVP